MPVDPRSEETAYATKDNIVVPEWLSTAQIEGARLRAAQIRSESNPPQALARSHSEAQVTETINIPREVNND